MIGHRGSGKDTLTNSILKELEGKDYNPLKLLMLRNMKTFSFADKLKRICGSMFYNGKYSMFEDEHKNKKYSGNLKELCDFSNRDLLRKTAKIIKDNFGVDFFAQDVVHAIDERIEEIEETEKNYIELGERDKVFIVRDLRFFSELLKLNEVCNRRKIEPLFVRIVREEVREEVENYEGDFDVNNLAKHISKLGCNLLTVYNRGNDFSSIKEHTDLILYNHLKLIKNEENQIQ